jgi:hypothetical protein
VSAKITITLEIPTHKQLFRQKNGFYGKIGFCN